MGTRACNAMAHELGNWLDIESDRLIDIEHLMRIG
jgi:hypothetical protein